MAKAVSTHILNVYTRLQIVNNSIISIQFPKEYTSLPFTSKLVCIIKYQDPVLKVYKEINRDTCLVAGRTIDAKVGGDINPGSDFQIEI